MLADDGYVDEMAVVTVGSLQAGMTENIIPDFAEVKINVRTVRKETRDKVLASVFRIIKAECMAGGCQKDPLIERSSEFPFTINDDEATLPLEKTFAEHFKDDFKGQIDRLLGSEDFSILGTAVKRPCCFWVVGMVDHAVWEEEVVKMGRDIPINHSPYFAPVIEPTLKASVDAMALAALTFMAKG
jgi:metal-dependent amidase/aminoacylase/carboxypeptidase family protein